MKEFTITISDIFKEIKLWSLSLMIAIALNIYAISTYEGSWSELFTEFHIILAISIIIYVILVLLRMIILTAKSIFKKLAH